jgi:hypothetical protein
MTRKSLAVLAFTLLTSLGCSGLSKSGGKAEKWTGEETWSCGGSEKKTLENLTVEVKGKDIIGVEAAGSCELTIVNCNITADFPLKAAGNAKVTVKGGTLNGRQQSIQSWGNAVVTLEGTKVVGETATTGNGKIIGP